MIKKFKRLIYSKLLIFFICISFLMLITAMMCLGGIVFLLIHLDVINPNDEQVILPIFFAIVFSVLTGTVISGVVGKRILSPISELRKNMSLVANGNFSKKIDEQAAVEEINYLIRDYNRMIEELNSIETLRNDFVSSVSHEFKTPLAIIRGYIQLLQESTLSEENKQNYFQQILKATNKLSDLTGNILRLNKLENHILGLEKKAFQLDEQIREIIVLLQPKWEKKEIIFDLDLERVNYYGNEELLFHVWLNIIDNAITYNNIRGVVTVELRMHDNTVICEIGDTGIGIDHSDIIHIFDKFYQADKSRSSQGNGLGLALVKRIVELHQGRIKVFSEENKGTTFEVNLDEF